MMGRRQGGQGQSFYTFRALLRSCASRHSSVICTIPMRGHDRNSETSCMAQCQHDNTIQAVTDDAGLNINSSKRHAAL
jgi:hypothetical protein